MIGKLLSHCTEHPTSKGKSTSKFSKSLSFNGRWPSSEHSPAGSIATTGDNPRKGLVYPVKSRKILWPMAISINPWDVSHPKKKTTSAAGCWNSQLAWRSSLGSSTEQLESENCSSSSGTSCVAVGSHRVQGWRVFWEWNYWCFGGWKTNNCGI